MSRGLSRAERLREMETLYLQRAFSDAEMAERLEVDRTTVFKDRTRLLSSECPIVQDEEGRYRIDRTHYLSNVRVNLQEALVLYLAMRRASRQTRFAAPHVIRALEKVALTLRQPMTEQLVKAANTILAQPASPEREAVVEAVVRGWAEQRKVRLVYQGLQARQPWNFLVSPYLIEPAAWSDGAYIIGHSDVHGDVAVFKIERILEATLKLETFTIPEAFDEAKLLDYAWGIWRGEGEPQTVRLRFQPGEAARRVKETVWHRLESVTDTPDGGCIWSAPIGEWQEMLPWIRGWGSQVEVMGPEGLRAEIIQHVRDLATQYKVIPSERKAYSYLWAKADKKDLGKIHRLVYHLIDVGQVALGMWNKAIDKETKRKFCEWLNCDEATVGRTLAFLISLHDLGKASPTFQIKYKPIIAEISKAGFWLPKDKPPQSSPHGVVSTWALISLLPKRLKVSEKDAKLIAKALGGHHGSWPIPAQMLQVNANDTGNNDPSWDTARQELVQAMFEVFNPILEFSLPKNQEELNVMLTLFSGFTSVADWVGSMTEFFPYEKSTNLPLDEYVVRSAQAAEKALSQLGWFGWQADGKTLTFKEVFPFITQMNSVQERIVEEVGKISQPALLILESPTGSGKTEAALYAADTWLQAQRGHGMYIAMPTQATSNQMYERVTDFLLKRYPAETLNFHLVHGGALLEDKKPVEAQGVSDDDDQNNAEGGIRAETWFLPRKRTLLAPFGVGTVDQALMSVLQTRHFFVRMFGLQNKVMVFDEVHAYDTYMSELFKQLLRWLRKIGVSVILLSATLPEKTRGELVAAYLGKKEAIVPSAKYPRLTIASATAEPQSIPLDAPSSFTVQLAWSDVDPKIIVEKLKDALRTGGCAAVICNRVQRAQDIYNEIKLAGLVPDEDLILFHARFPFQWRKEIEDKVLDRFGKGKDGKENPNRPQKSVVVATQVIEQSLDLDFDYMISDLAPIDLLIQRAGRLHRHSQNDSSRPENLKNAKLQIVSPQAQDIPEFGNDEYIYDRSVMLKTWLTLKDQTEMNLPSQTTFLIEKVYGEDFAISDEALRKEMEEAIEKAEQKERKAIVNAARQLIAAPHEEDLLNQRNNNLDEDDPTVNAAFRAMTRDAEPGVSLICLHRVNGKLYFDPANANEPLDSTVKPEKDLAREILKHSVNLQNYAAVKYFSENKPEMDWKHWKEVAVLKYAIPIVFENGRCKLEGTKYTLVLDRQTGLEIRKEDQ